MQKYDQDNEPRHENNLREIEQDIHRALHSAIGTGRSFQLSCQARLGKLVWLGDLIEDSKANLVLRQFEGRTRFVNRKPYLKHEFYTRYIHV